MGAIGGREVLWKEQGLEEHRGRQPCRRDRSSRRYADMRKR